MCVFYLLGWIQHLRWPLLARISLRFGRCWPRRCGRLIWQRSASLQVTSLVARRKAGLSEQTAGKEGRKSCCDWSLSSSACTVDSESTGSFEESIGFFTAIRKTKIKSSEDSVWCAMCVYYPGYRRWVGVRRVTKIDFLFSTSSSQVLSPHQYGSVNWIRYYRFAIKTYISQAAREH